MKFCFKQALVFMAVAIICLSTIGIVAFPLFGRIGMTVLSVIALLVSAFVVGGLVNEDTRS